MTSTSAVCPAPTLYSNVTIANVRLLEYTPLGVKWCTLNWCYQQIIGRWSRDERGCSQSYVTILCPSHPTVERSEHSDKEVCRSGQCHPVVIPSQNWACTNVACWSTIGEYDGLFKHDGVCVQSYDREPVSTSTFHPMYHLSLILAVPTPQGLKMKKLCIFAYE